jgi:hypothetical protein
MKIKINKYLNTFTNLKSLEIEVPTFCLVIGCVSARRDRRYHMEYIKLIRYPIINLSSLWYTPDRQRLIWLLRKVTVVLVIALSMKYREL